MITIPLLFGRSLELRLRKAPLAAIPAARCAGLSDGMERPAERRCEMVGDDLAPHVDLSVASFNELQDSALWDWVRREVAALERRWGTRAPVAAWVYAQGPGWSSRRGSAREFCDFLLEEAAR